MRISDLSSDVCSSDLEVQLSVILKRLDGEENRFSFAASEEYLRGNGTVTEPHSFDVTVIASHAGKSHSWKYASYERSEERRVGKEWGSKCRSRGPRYN